MRTPLLLVALAGLALAAPLVSAQQSASLTIYAETPSEIISGTPTTVAGTAIFTADYTAILGVSGIPVAYSISAMPEWATVVISPSSDVFPMPSTPGFGLSYTAARQFQVTIMTSHDLPAWQTGLIEITATTEAATLGRSAVAKTTIPVTAGPSHCPEAPLEAATEGAAPPLAAPEESPTAAPSEGGEVTVQQAATSPVSTPWLVVAAFGLVGASVGIVLRQRMRG